MVARMRGADASSSYHEYALSVKTIGGKLRYRKRVIDIDKRIHDNDHRGTMTAVDINITAKEPIQRKVFCFHKAHWCGLRAALVAHNWEAMFSSNSANDQTEAFTSTLLDMVNRFVPSRMIVDKSFAHPWINQTCRDALAAKQKAVGTAGRA